MAKLQQRLGLRILARVKMLDAEGKKQRIIRMPLSKPKKQEPKNG